jgi:hypothetical protein
MRRCLAVLLIVAGCLAATQAIAERRVALVVGNSQYEHTAALPNPRNDAEDMARALARVGFEVKVGLDLDQTRFARIIDEFAQALEGADVGLFFYAGHGLQISDKNYLVSTQAKLESTFLVPSETIELDAVIRLMESKTGTNLVFLDACRNNPLTENLKRNLTAAHRDVASVGRGLAPIAPTGHDTLVAFSAAPGELAADGTGRNSPFAAALLRHLPEPGLEVSVMLKDVTADVRQETSNVQRPQQLSDMSRKFYFVKAEPAAAAAPPAAPPPTAPSDSVELAFWRSAEAANECESIRAYRRRYPNGSFSDLAILAERRLCKAGPEAAALPATPPTPVPAPTVAPAPSPAPSAATAALRSLIGLHIQPVTKDIADALGLKEARGALVAESLPDSPASKAGIKAGDIITAVNGRAIGDARDAARTVGGLSPGDAVVLTVIRGAQEKTFSLTAGSLPETAAAPQEAPANPAAVLRDADPNAGPPFEGFPHRFDAGRFPGAAGRRSRR